MRNIKINKLKNGYSLDYDDWGQRVEVFDKLTVLNERLYSFFYERAKLDDTVNGLVSQSDGGSCIDVIITKVVNGYTINYHKTQTEIYSGLGLVCQRVMVLFEYESKDNRSWFKRLFGMGE